MIDPKDTALLIIDMQNGFIDADSSLCVAGAAATIPACARALDHARSLGVPVFHVRRVYADDGSDVEASRLAIWLDGGRPVSHASKKPGSVDFPPELAPHPEDRVINKPRFSAFFGTELDMVLRRLGKSTVIIIGTTTPNCLRTTCYDALSLDYNVALIEDCTSSRTPEVQKANIEDMAFIGAYITTLKDFEAGFLAGMKDCVKEARASLG